MVRTYANSELLLTTLLPIVVDLEDIQAMMEVEDTEEEHNVPQIYLESWACVKRRAMSALHYHVPFMEEDVRQTAKEYLMVGLQRVSVENFDQEKSSLILKGEEDMLVLTRAGFLPRSPGN
jgi:hypothetical protein